MSTFVSMTGIMQKLLTDIARFHGPNVEPHLIRLHHTTLNEIMNAAEAQRVVSWFPPRIFGIVYHVDNTLEPGTWKVE